MSTLISSLVHEVTTTAGAGAQTIAAVNARRTFNTAFGTGGSNVFYYAMLHRTVNEWEYGTGHLSSSTVLVRDTVIASSNANSTVTFTAGTIDVLNDLPAEFQLSEDDAALLYQPLDTDLTSWAAVVRASGFDTFVATPSLANLGSLLTNEAAGAMTFLTTPTSANLATLVTDDLFSLADAELGAIAGLTSAADKGIYFTGSGTAALFDMSSAMRTFHTTPSSANLAALVSDDLFSLADAELGAIAGLTSAADKGIYFTGSGTAALFDMSSAMRTFHTTPSSANLAALVSDDAFSLSDVELGSIAGLTSAADKFPYFTGLGTAALADLSSAMRTFLTTPSSANFASLVTGETGSGALVFATSPGFTTAANPISNDGAALGTTSLGWADLFLADNAVINYGNGGVTATHVNSSDSLTISLDSANALASTQFNVDVDGARTVSVNATGVAFNADTADANSLDDYEEGTWEPIYYTTGTQFSSITHDTAFSTGTYTKIGNVVFYTISIRTDAVTIGAATGAVTIDGPPFTPPASPDFPGCGALSSLQTWAGDYAGWTIMSGSANGIRLLYRTAVNGAPVGVAPSDVGTGADANSCYCAGHYHVA